ncbi:DNA-directed DNA polymerase [Tanacetum coccineum]
MMVLRAMETYDGEINLEHDKNLISNEFAVKLCLEHEVKNGDKVVKKELIVSLRGEIYFMKFIINPKEDDIEPGVVLERSFLRLTKGIADFGNKIITIYPDLDPFNDDFDKVNDLEDDWDAILEGIDFGDIPKINRLELPPYVCYMGKSSRNKKKPSENYKMKYDDKGPSLTVNRALTRRFDTHALSDTGSNINIIPYRIFEGLGREHVKPVSHNVSMLNHSEAEPMGMLKEVLCQVGETTVLARFLILDMPVDHTVPIIIGMRYNTNLARILSKQVYSPCIVDWTVLNTLGRGDTIEEMPEIKFVTKITKRLGILTDEVLDGLSAPTYCRALDVLTLKELTSPNGRLIAEDPAPGVLRAATPRSIRPTITDLYDKIDRMETCHGTLDRMAHRQSYQLDRYAGVFKCMVRQYNVPMQGVCAPPGYNEEQQDDQE